MGAKKKSTSTSTIVPLSSIWGTSQDADDSWYSTEGNSTNNVSQVGTAADVSRSTTHIAVRGSAVPKSHNLAQWRTEANNNDDTQSVASSIGTGSNYSTSTNSTRKPHNHHQQFIAFIGNVENSATEEELGAWCREKIGPVVEVRIVRKEGKGTIAYVEFSSEGALNVAVSMHEKVFFKARRLRIDKAEGRRFTPRPQGAPPTPQFRNSTSATQHQQQQPFASLKKKEHAEKSNKQAAQPTPTTTEKAIPQIQEAEFPVHKSFDTMALRPELLRGVYTHGFEEPTEVQQRAIVPLTQGRDVVVQVPSGRGKSGAFIIGSLQRIDTNVRKCQVMILSPTRELADQTCEVTRSISRYMSTSSKFVTGFVGGTKVGENLMALESGEVRVAVGTPGRIEDLLRRGAIRSDGLRVLILDEADEMLSQGFQQQLINILKYLPKDVQIGLFSATMDDGVRNISDNLLRSPLRLLMEAEDLSLKGIKQWYVAVPNEDKLETLLDLYERCSVSQCVVFANSKQTADLLKETLEAEQHSVAMLHADVDKLKRVKEMDRFRKGDARVLVATDLMARGIDVQHVNVVINYEFPYSVDTYLHRIGRSGRHGRKGVAINFVDPAEESLMRNVENHYRITLQELTEDFMSHLSE